ncbi:MAG: zinc ribbon domain-containing protein [Armatimonadota bacterium]|nr:zinc ribbon domain-containing protein [Armatimonadota bacterium]MDR7464962.1 zinc ribbon domain-containing protein [Armatimonadota bacterium]
MWRRALYRILLGVALAAGGSLWNLPGALSSGVTQVTFTALGVDIRPEHDDPRVLVIYRGTLSAQASLPYPLTFTIPAGARVHAAAYRRDGQLFAAQYQTEREGERTRVTFLTPVPGFQFEYYADLLTGRPQRTFTVELTFPLAVEALEVSVERPLRSTGFTLTPAPARIATGGGFTYYLYAEDRWPAGKVWSVRGTYRKEDDEPSLPRTAALPGPASPGVLQPGVAPPGGPGPLVWLLPALLGIITGVAGSLAVMWLRGIWTGRGADTRGWDQNGIGGRGTGAGGRDRDRTVRRSPQPPERFCSSCGAPAAPGDRFCTRCGHPLTG